MYTCLMYHETETPRTYRFSVELSLFVEQMENLVSNGIVAYRLGERISDDRHYCMLTFDDGHVSNLQAAEALSDLGLKGYFFLIKDYSLERADYLSECDIKKISEMGHCLGVHGKNHDQWPKIKDKKLIHDLRETKDWIEQLTGQQVISCSAPGGNINQRTIELIRSEIPELKYIRTSRYGVNQEDDTVLKSIGVRGDYSVEKVLHLATNDFWEMRKIMAYYHTKELIKPVYHFFRK